MRGLELLSASGLWLLGALAPLVLLYVLKIERARRKVPSTLLWAAARRDLMSKRPFKRLVAELPLVLQVLALVALAFALARPAARGGRIAGAHVAIVIDTSASMGARTRAGGTRMDDAKRAAEDAVSALAPGADALVIEAARDARVATPMERDPKQLRAAIARLAVREVEGDLSAAVALAADRLRAAGGAARIVVFTDGALAHPAPLAAAGIPTDVVTVGDDAENAAIVRVDVRDGVDPTTKRDEAQVFAIVENFGARPRDAFVTASVDGRPEPVASRRVLVRPGERAPVVLSFAPREGDLGAGLVVELAPDPSDVLALDDVAYARVPAGQRMPVTLASRAPYSWTARALDADARVSLQRVSLEQLATVNVDPDALVVVEGACPDAQAIPGRDALVLAPPEGRCLGVDVGAPVEQPLVTSWETGDPRMRFLTMDGVHVARARPLAAQGAGASLVRAGKITLIADASLPGRAATIVGFDPGDSDWPLEASFVLFVRNVVEQARAHRAQGAVGAVRTGDPLRVAVPAGVDAVKVDGPGVTDREVSARAGFAIVPSVERAGLYRVRWTSPRVGGVLVPANLTSDKESDLRARPVTVAADGGAQAPSLRAVQTHHEWAPWLALLAALALAADLVWLTRRARASVAPPAPRVSRAARGGGA